MPFDHRCDSECGEQNRRHGIKAKVNSKGWSYRNSVVRDVMSQLNTWTELIIREPQLRMGQTTQVDMKWAQRESSE